MKLYLQWLVHRFCPWGLQHCWFVLTDIFPCSQVYHHSLNKDKEKSTKQFSHSFPGYPLPRVRSFILLLVVNFVILDISIVNLPPNSREFWEGASKIITTISHWHYVIVQNLPWWQSYGNFGLFIGCHSVFQLWLSVCDISYTYI